MALDDFAPASGLPGPSPDGPQPDVQPNAHPADEDLFSFPAPIAEPGDAAAVPQAAASDRTTDDDLMSDPPAAKPVETEIECTGLDPELDVDIFGFPPLDLSSLGVEEESVPEIEDSIEAATQSVHAMLQDDLSDSMQDVATGHDLEFGELPPAQPTAEQLSAAPTPQETVFAQPQYQVQAAPVQFALPAGVGGSKALWVLTGAAVLFMFGLLAIAWRATSSFQQQIEQVRAEVSTSNAQIQRETAGELQQIVELQGELLRAAPQGTAEVERIPAMESPHETVLTVAREAIATGRFADARRMLFTLLAEADRFPVDSREDMERRASFLIAASHKREAETLQENVK